ncbi:DUF3667 domain-containing protein [Lysobacter niabensis]|uniref:DUF3667 domain-containing protein n=1 Tax=Agrilutibacter niabensis TaxID=380628 RepID=UPI003606BB3C
MSGQDTQGVPAACENCGTPLRGHYCHACGQSVHSPTRHFGHALEEVLESFWHLDGRVFRTMRDLLFPGRIAVNYLAGQRIRYIAPLRLFVIVSLLTFFVGKLVVHMDEPAIQFGGEGGAAMAQARTPEEVRQIEARLLKKLSVEEAKAAKVPGVNAALIATRARIQGEAASRIVELEAEEKKRHPAGGGSASTAQTAVTPAASSQVPPGASGVAAAPAAKPSVKPAPAEGAADEWKFNDRPWNEKTNPVDVPLAPGFVDRWVNRKIARAQENMEHMDEKPDQFVQAALSAVPTALFFLMPVFALLLKLLYLGSGRRYLEHLVVALYSHAWLLLAVLAMFVMNAIDDAFTATWVAVVTALVDAALWIWIPIYLFLMQRRVYGDHWALTAVRYLVIGSIYMVMVLFVVMFAVLAGIVA